MDFLLAGADFLRRRGCPSPRLDAELLLAHRLGRERLTLYLDFERPLSQEEQDDYRRLLLRRAEGEPVAYILGEKEFFSRTFRVDRRVLIPRPESELLVEVGLKALPRESPGRFADVGTGSGCLAVALAGERPRARGWLTDISPAALEVAGENVARAGLTGRLQLFPGDLLAPLQGILAPGSLDLVVCNPPYVEPGDPDLEPEVAAWEPAAALHPGPGGFGGLCRRLALQARDLLKPGGLLALECPPTRIDQARAALGEGWEPPNQETDTAGHQRVVHARRGRTTASP